MSNLIVLLIAVATAFPAGWLLCRAWLRASGEPTGDSISQKKHHAMLQAQRSRYRRQVQKVMEVVRKHEAARDALRTKLDDIDEHTESQQQQNQRLQTQLETSRQEADSVRAEAETSRQEAAGVRAELEASRQDADSARAELESSRQEAADVRAELEALQSRGGSADDRIKKLEHELSLLQIERDELRAKITRQELDAARAATQKDAAESDKSRAERGELREKLAAAEHRQKELEGRLRDREMRIEELQQNVESWKHRVAPMARQIQSYREAINKLQRSDSEPATPPAEPETPTDDLQRIRGIGPALERRLRANGIRSFNQIAALDPVELAALADRLAIAPSLPERDEWIRQAREFAGDGDLAAAV